MNSNTYIYKNTYGQSTEEDGWSDYWTDERTSTYDEDWLDDMEEYPVPTAVDWDWEGDWDNREPLQDVSPADEAS